MVSKRDIAGKKLNPIGLGCMSLSHGYGHPPEPKDGADMLLKALDLGYDHFDTAQLYGRGQNEILIGETLASRRDEFFLASKCGIIIDENGRRIDCRPDTVKWQIDDSLKKLKTDYIDLYYLHRRDFDVPIEESVGAIADCIKEGKVGAIGISEMSAETLRAGDKEHHIAAVQSEYSLWTRNPEIAVLEACKELGTTFVAFSPVGRGVLAGGVKDPSDLVETDLRLKQPRFKPEHWPANRKLIDKFLDLAAETDFTPAQLALAWVLSRGENVVAIPGTANPKHLAENIAMWDKMPPNDVLEAANALINQSTVSGNRYGAAMQPTIETEQFT